MSNIKNLDLNLLKALDALLDEQNVSRAAQKLNLTQPAVSSILAKLRDKFDDPLFIRTATGLMPTERALSLAEPVKRILHDIERLVAIPEFDPSLLERTFKIAATDNITRRLVLPLTQHLLKISPKIKIAFLSAQGRDLEELLRKGELDLVIVAESAMPVNLRAKVLYHEHYVCVMSKTHPLASQELDLEAFCAYQQVLVSYWGGNFQGATDLALREVNKQREVVLSINNFLLLPEILRKSDYIAIAPAHLVTANDELVVKKPPIEVKGYNKLMGWHERVHYDQVHKWLREQVVQIVEELERAEETLKSIAN
ncbi:transcriptional regulator [Psittacicella hinzii]|uniref:Transcriptional regulator n=1 Tax=Psittacicella hinzii TaxID=2028575 RepID=A0A3A1Y350_9GAMM|nr:LysR family transcriptional regulator [Psittacicella hinzii]RIY31871.1 transcriptional regulator [Psittacicella hinzii]